MIYNSLLSIVVPTYNRADFLDYCLEFHIPLAREYNIQIFISDNASTDNTREIVSKWMKEYPLLKYHQNASNVGPDRNFEIGLKLPDTEYIWLLGDTYQIPSNGIEYFLRLFPENNKYEVIICNVENRVLNIPSQRYKNPNKLLNDLGWHLTCLSSLIYSSRLVAQADFERYYNTSFIQTGIIFEYIAEKNFTIYWSDSISVMGINDTRLKKRGWTQEACVFDIACVAWSNFIFSLPCKYDLHVKLKCILDHGTKSNIFSFNNLLFLRSMNILNYKTYKQYSYIFPFTISYSKYIIVLISLLPRKTYNFLRFFWRFLKRNK